MQSTCITSNRSSPGIFVINNVMIFLPVGIIIVYPLRVYIPFGTISVIFVPLEIIFQTICSVWNLSHEGTSISWQIDTNTCIKLFPIILVFETTSCFFNLIISLGVHYLFNIVRLQMEYPLVLSGNWGSVRMGRTGSSFAMEFWVRGFGMARWMPITGLFHSNIYFLE